MRRGSLYLTTMGQLPSWFPDTKVVMSTILTLGPMTSTVRIQGVNSTTKVPPGHHDTIFTTIDFKGLVRS